MQRHGWILLSGLLTAWTAGAEELPPPQVSAVPIPDGQVAMATARVAGLVAETMARTGVPGMAVAVVSGGEVTLAEGYGVREAGKPEPVDADTVFQLASVSKSLGATVVATQVGRGKLDWDTPIAELLPWFALSNPHATALLTVADLYAHRSGLPDHAGDDLEDLGYSRREVLERLRLLPLEGFRDHYAYTNFGLTAGAEAVAAAAGSDWETLSETAIYGPLGMSSTSSRFADFMARENRAVPHMRSGDGWAPLAQREPDAQTPAGGVSSSAADMAKWMLMVLGEGSYRGEPVMPPAALLPAISPQSVSSPPYVPDARAGFYGYGFNVGTSPSGRVTLGHSGGFYLGAGTTYLLIPSADAGIVVLTNAQPIGAAEAVALAFADLAQFGHVTRDWFATLGSIFAPMYAPLGKLADQTPPADASAPRDLAAYAGSYRNDYFGPAEVAVEGDGLVLKAGPEGMTFPLEHWSGDSFVFTPRGENAPEGSRSEVAFRMGADTSEAMTVEFWNEYGLGTFER